MRSRGSNERRVSASIIGHHPRESVALFVGGSAIIMICVNALFMQPGPHPAPIFARPVSAHGSTAAGPLAPAPLSSRPARFEPAQVEKLPLPRPFLEAVKPKQASDATRHDPIAQLLAPSTRVAAAQRILTAYGYGQIRPTGVLDSSTEQAIRKFEASHKMPVTGQTSDAVIQALSAMSGQRIE